MYAHAYKLILYLVAGMDSAQCQVTRPVVHKHCVCVCNVCTHPQNGNQLVCETAVDRREVRLYTVTQ